MMRNNGWCCDRVMNKWGVGNRGVVNDWSGDTESGRVWSDDGRSDDWSWLSVHDGLSVRYGEDLGGWSAVSVSRGVCGWDDSDGSDDRGGDGVVHDGGSVKNWCGVDDGGSMGHHGVGMLGVLGLVRALDSSSGRKSDSRQQGEDDL